MDGTRLQRSGTRLTGTAWVELQTSITYRVRMHLELPFLQSVGERMQTIPKEAQTTVTGGSTLPDRHSLIGSSLR
jgi:hypothetical protein